MNIGYDDWGLLRTRKKPGESKNRRAERGEDDSTARYIAVIAPLHYEYVEGKRLRRSNEEILRRWEKRLLRAINREITMRGEQATQNRWRKVVSIRHEKVTMLR